MDKPTIEAVIKNWRLPERGSLTERINAMIRRDLMKGLFGSSATLIVGGVQYHLGGVQDTEDLAKLAGIIASDQVLDVACFLGGPALQLAEAYQSRVRGIDKNEFCVRAANKIASMCGLHHRARFEVADARELPFEDGTFSVVWSQCSLAHDETWLQEMHRVLKHPGRLALTFAIRRENPDQNSPQWSLHDVVHHIQDLGYTILHAEDITRRDIDIGWRALDNQLSEREDEFTVLLGEEWVRRAHLKFATEIELMQNGQWGNGRIIAEKTS